MAVANLKIADAIDRNKNSKNYDEVCKEILSNKQILAHIMKACVPEYQDVPLSEIPSYIEHDPLLNVSMDEDGLSNGSTNECIKGMNTEDHSVSGAEIRYDILFDAKLPNTAENERVGLFINVEAQNAEKLQYPLLSRAVYYDCRLVAGQKNRKDGFDHSDFKHLKKVYSIWIIMDAKKEQESIFNVYTIKENCILKEYHFPKEHYDKLSIVIVCPESIYDVNDEDHSFMELLHILFKAKMSAADKKYHLTKNYGIMMTRKIAEEVDEMCNLSQGIKNEGIAEGLTKGRAEGRAEGRCEGKTDATILNIKNLMESFNIDVDKALDALKISDDLRPIVKEKLS